MQPGIEPRTAYSDIEFSQSTMTVTVAMNLLNLLFVENILQCYLVFTKNICTSTKNPWKNFLFKYKIGFHSWKNSENLITLSFKSETIKILGSIRVDIIINFVMDLYYYVFCKQYYIQLELHLVWTFWNDILCFTSIKNDCYESSAMKAFNATLYFLNKFQNNMLSLNLLN